MSDFEQARVLEQIQKLNVDFFVLKKKKEKIAEENEKLQRKVKASNEQLGKEISQYRNKCLQGKLYYEDLIDKHQTKKQEVITLQSQVLNKEKELSQVQSQEHIIDQNITKMEEQISFMNKFNQDPRYIVKGIQNWQNNLKNWAKECIRICITSKSQAQSAFQDNQYFIQIFSLYLFKLKKNPSQSLMLRKVKNSSKEKFQL